MSDVAGAFKILVQAQPDQAISAFRDILQATDKAASGVSGWTDKVLGLNQAWELGSKMMGLASSAASAIGGAFSDLASRGGEFNELKSSFEGLASSAGLSAGEIVKQIKGISDGTVTVRESMQLANRAIVAGFSGPDIETAFKFAKKLSESGRGDFSELANTIVDSMAKGKYSTLNSFGVMIEKGESFSSAMGKVADEVNKFPDAAFNYQDSITAIGKSWEDFKDEIGGAINDSLEFQSVISWVQDTIGDFLASFDYSKVTEWVDVAIKSAGIMADEFGIDFANIKKYMNSAWSGGMETALSFFEGIIKGYSSLKSGTAEIFNFVISALNSISGSFTEFYGGVQVGFAQIGNFIEETWTDAQLVLTKTLLSMLEELDKYQAAASGILGVEASDEITKFANELNSVYIEAAKSAKQAKKENEEFVDALVLNLDKGRDSAGHIYDGMKINTEKIKDDANELLRKVGDISVKISEYAADESVKIQRKAFADYRKEQEEAKKEEDKTRKEYEKQWTEARKREAQVIKDAFSFAQSEEEKALKRQQEDALENFKKELSARREYRDENGAGTRFSGNVSEEEKTLQEKALKDFRRKQEDEMDKFRFDQKKKEREFEEGGKKIEVKKDATAEAVDNLAQAQRETQEQAKAERQDQKTYRLVVDPTGNNSLDVLLNSLLSKAYVMAEAENRQVISG